MASKARVALSQTGRWLRRHKAVSGAIALALFVAATALSIPISILMHCSKDETRPADAAIVLGAAVQNSKPTPVFLERIRHGVNLYHAKQVRKLVFTGGMARGDDLAEAEAARVWAVENGVNGDDIITESKSTTTWENFTFAAPMLRSEGLKTLLVVSDPMHMRRSVSMARSLGIDAYASPTPTTRYVSLGSKWHFLKHETVYYAAFLWRRLTGQLIR